MPLTVGSLSACPFNGTRWSFGRVAELLNRKEMLCIRQSALSDYEVLLNVHSPLLPKITTFPGMLHPLFATSQVSMSLVLVGSRTVTFVSTTSCIVKTVSLLS